MPPNYLVKPTFERSDLDNVKRGTTPGKSSVRTSFVLRNVFSHLLHSKFHFPTVLPATKNEEWILKHLIEIVDAFNASYHFSVRRLCLDLEVTEETIESVLLGVSSELFSEGITWSRIIAFFVFVGEFTLQCLIKKFPDSIVDEVFLCFSKLVEEKLQSWIADHGNWEGLTSLSIQQQENLVCIDEPKSPNPGWCKNLLYGTVRMIGTLAHIANTSSHAIP